MAKSLPAIGKYLYYLIKVGDLRVFDSGNRCSEMAKSQPPKEMMTGPSPMSIATKLCQMGLETAAHNRERHDAVENFFITNDSATVATEVPVFASADEMRKVRADWNLGDLHGHIDILQWRNGRIFILDYKPDMKDEAATHHQLSFYARLLSIRTSVPMSNIRCGYFNEHVYKEFDAVM